MAYCEILATNKWSSGTVSALTAASGLPATNTQSPERTKKWRSDSSTTGQYLLCDMGSSVSCDYAAIANLTRQNGEAVKLYEGGTGASPGAYNLVATFPTQSDDTNLSQISFVAVSARHWKIQWTNTGAAAVAEAGYVGLGAKLALTRRCSATVDFDRIDPSVESVSVDGQKTYTSRTTFYSGSLTFEFLQEADATLFHTLWRTVKRQAPFFFSLDTTLGNQNWLMRLGSGLSLKRFNGASVTYYVVKFGWEEAR